MAVTVHYVTDPACPWSWAFEPVVRRLQSEFGDGLRFTYVMGGLAREIPAGADSALEWTQKWLDAADESGMPFDPLLWRDGPLGSSYPACMGVKAAAEQGPERAAAYLRSVREGIFCFRRKLDATEALVEEARRARLDVERFRVDLGSHAIVEAFGADLERARDVPEQARDLDRVRCSAGQERVPFPTLYFTGADGERHDVFGFRSYEEVRAAAERAGAEPAGDGTPDVLSALRRFGRLAQAEVEAVCDLPGPRAAAELWRLAGDWRVRPLRALTGLLWEPA